MGYHNLITEVLYRLLWPRDLCYVRYWRRNDDGSYGSKPITLIYTSLVWAIVYSFCKEMYLLILSSCILTRLWAYQCLCLPRTRNKHLAAIQLEGFPWINLEFIWRCCSSIVWFFYIQFGLQLFYFVQGSTQVVLLSQGVFELTLRVSSLCFSFSNNFHKVSCGCWSDAFYTFNLRFICPVLDFMVPCKGTWHLIHDQRMRWMVLVLLLRLRI